MPIPDPSSFSYEPKQVAEYSWTEEFEGRRLPIKVRVFHTPVDVAATGIKARGKYNTSVLIGADWHPLIGRDYEPSEPELKALVRDQMPTWKNTGVI
jgi:hypothetical protein